MKIELLIPCNGPRCKNPAMYVIRLDSGAVAVKVCDAHLSWGEKRAAEIENS